MQIKRWIGTAVVGAVLLAGSAVQAADTLLANEVLQLPQGEVTAELWGDRLPNGYANDLLVLIKDKDKKIITAYAPSIKGGYNCLLNVVKPGREKSSQLLVSAGQGDWSAPSEYRVLSFADSKNVQEVFTAAESMGLVANAYIKEKKLQVQLINERVDNVNLEQGVEAEDGTVSFGGLHSLIACDVDNDGVDELLGSERLLQGKTPLADIGVVWKRDQEDKKWETLGTTIMTLGVTSKDNTVNDGVDFAAGMILPRRLVVRGGEATFPVFACKDAELQNKINKVLWSATVDDLAGFYTGKADTAFKVMRAAENLLSIQFIYGKTTFTHHHVNIDPKTGEKILLSDILNTRDKDLLPLLQLLCTNKKMKFTDKLPDEWYIEGNNLFLLQHIDGQDEIAGFNMGNLHKFILKKQILE